MAVYTPVSDADLKRFVARYDIGAGRSLTPIAQGIENSNYRLETDSGTYILTIYESRVSAVDLPFFLDLMGHLAGRHVPCPIPVRDIHGECLQRLSGKPTALVTFLPGDWPRTPDTEQCRALGSALAELHHAGGDFGGERRNGLSVAAWGDLFAPLQEKADTLRPGLSQFLSEEIADVQAHWPDDLPTGIIHADLFPDNVFFENGAVSGIIDFYFACNDLLAYDLAITLNAWCFGAGAEENAEFSQPRSAALLEGYTAVRPVTDAETRALPLLARGAALRFLLTRLHDWFLPVEDALTRRKDPLALLPILEFHRGVTDSAVYG